VINVYKSSNTLDWQIRNWNGLQGSLSEVCELILKQSDACAPQCASPTIGQSRTCVSSVSNSSTSTSVLGHFGPRSLRSFFEDRIDRGPKWLKTDLVESLRSLGPNCTSEGPICTSWYYTQNVLKSMTVEEEDTHRNIIREGVDFMIETLGVHPLRSLVTWVLSHFGPRTEVHIHFGL